MVDTIVSMLVSSRVSSLRPKRCNVGCWIGVIGCIPMRGMSNTTAFIIIISVNRRTPISSKRISRLSATPTSRPFSNTPLWQPSCQYGNGSTMRPTPSRSYKCHDGDKRGRKSRRLWIWMKRRHSLRSFHRSIKTEPPPRLRMDSNCCSMSFHPFSCPDSSCCRLLSWPYPVWAFLSLPMLSLTLYWPILYRTFMALLRL
mmetsp:Transcript_23939/g.40670  ORF Transcript_23939/g.40670 Transcript_23939/m.40670 type:complete len:200 (+) Transcript_23939:438-1037(+)